MVNWQLSNQAICLLASSEYIEVLCLELIEFACFFLIDHFPVLCSVTWPLNGSKAGVDLPFSWYRPPCFCHVLIIIVIIIIIIIITIIIIVIIIIIITIFY